MHRTQDADEPWADSMFRSSPSCIEATLRSHPAHADSIGRLCKAGVTVMDPDSVTTRDDDGLAAFDWVSIRQEIRRLEPGR